MPARITEVCDAVVARLVALTPGLSAVRSYTPDEAEDGILVAPEETTAYVFPVRRGQDGNASRGRDLLGYGVAVVVVAPVALPLVTADVDALVEWVEGSVYDPLQNPRLTPVLPAPCESLFPQSAEWVQIYDPDELRRGIFVSELAFQFQDIA